MSCWAPPKTPEPLIFATPRSEFRRLLSYFYFFLPFWKIIKIKRCFVSHSSSECFELRVSARKQTELPHEQSIECWKRKASPFCQFVISIWVSIARRKHEMWFFPRRLFENSPESPYMLLWHSLPLFFLLDTQMLKEKSHTKKVFSKAARRTQILEIFSMPIALWFDVISRWGKKLAMIKHARSLSVLLYSPPWKNDRVLRVRGEVWFFFFLTNVGPFLFMEQLFGLGFSLMILLFIESIPR